MFRRLILVIVVFVTALSFGTFATTTVRAFFYAPEAEVPLPENKPSSREHASGTEPVRIRIPALNIDTAVQHVGINDQGNMAAPTNYTDVGWYRHGPAPGESGSAVIAGHVNNGLGLSGVFENLSSIKAGDDIYVVRADGSEVHFVVASTRSYPYNDAPEEIIFNPSGSVRLNLITCEGKWVKEDRTYDQRFVVFAKLPE